MPHNSSALINSKLYKLATQKNNAIAKHHVGLCYEYGIGVDKDFGKAASFYSESFKLGYITPQSTFLAACTYEHMLDEGNHTEERKKELEEQLFSLYKMSADQGYATAQTHLGSLYYRGAYGIQKNETEALRLLKLAANQGEASAYLMLGVCYISDKNYAEAIKWLTRAAEDDNYEALRTLGFIYFSSNTGYKDYAKAYNYLQKAAGHNISDREEANRIYQSLALICGEIRGQTEQRYWYTRAADSCDDYNAQFVLGISYWMGQLGTTNYVEAVKYLKKAIQNKRIDNDINKIRFALGMIYFEGGHGIAENRYESIKWLKEVYSHTKSGEELEFKACHYLSVLYLAEKDIEESAKWLERAYAHGRVDNDLAYTVASHYLKGDGVSKDKDKAKKFLSMAANQGDSRAQEVLDELNSFFWGWLY